MTASAQNRLMTSREVARLFGVDPKTVTRWARRGWLPHQITPGGHFRFRYSSIVGWLVEHGGDR